MTSLFPSSCSLIELTVKSRELQYSTTYTAAGKTIKAVTVFSKYLLKKQYPDYNKTEKTAALITKMHKMKVCAQLRKMYVK